MLSPAEVLASVPPAAAYALVGVLVLSESVLLVGTFIPTLTLLLTAGALARSESLALGCLVAVAATAVVLGDAAGHRTGLVLGSKLRTGRLGRRIPAGGWARAESLMGRHGGKAVFLCRFLPVLRTVTPHMAGAAGLPYRRIAPYSAVAALLWAGCEVGCGYLMAASIERIAHTGGLVLIAAGIAAAVLVCVYIILSRSKPEVKSPGGPAASAPPHVRRP
ncbi:DedA family protein [Streptomyces sp. NPDC002262]|uniref:DedA family protein n=1 Tax=Streptomyces sp. NPDC002262 TaxID=3154414 RepID=UPI0033252628